MLGWEHETHILIIDCIASGVIVSVRQQINHRKKMIRFSSHAGEEREGDGQRHQGMQETKARPRNIWVESYTHTHTFLMYGRRESELGRVPTISRSCMGRKADDSGTRPTHIPPFVRQADLVPIARVTHALRSIWDVWMSCSGFIGTPNWPTWLIWLRVIAYTLFWLMLLWHLNRMWKLHVSFKNLMHGRCSVCVNIYSVSILGCQLSIFFFFFFIGSFATEAWSNFPWIISVIEIRYPLWI